MFRVESYVESQNLGRQFVGIQPKRGKRIPGIPPGC
jgi:hypothetical protein